MSEFPTRVLHCVKYVKTLVFSDLYFPYKDRIVDSVFVRKNADLRKTVFWHISRSVVVRKISPTSISKIDYHGKISGRFYLLMRKTWY